MKKLFKTAGLFMLLTSSFAFAQTTQEEMRDFVEESTSFRNLSNNDFMRNIDWKSVERHDENGKFVISVNNTTKSDIFVINQDRNANFSHGTKSLYTVEYLNKGLIENYNLDKNEVTVDDGRTRTVYKTDAYQSTERGKRPKCSVEYAGMAAGVGALMSGFSTPVGGIVVFGVLMLMCD